LSGEQIKEYSHRYDCSPHFVFLLQVSSFAVSVKDSMAIVLQMNLREIRSLSGVREIALSVRADKFTYFSG
jgi:hypothetical protein